MSGQPSSWETWWEVVNEQVETVNEYLLQYPLTVASSVVVLLLSVLLWRCFKSSKKKRE